MTERGKKDRLISPNDGGLVDLMVSEEEYQELLERSSRLKSVRISSYVTTAIPL